MKQDLVPSRTPGRSSRWFYGWTIVIAVGIASLAGGAGANPVLGVFQGPMTEEFGWSRSMYALPISVGSFIGGLAGMAVGPLIDRHGARWIMTAAIVILGLTFVITGAVQSFWQHVAIQLVGRTVTTSTFFLIVGVVVPKWFVQMRGRAIALANLGQRGGVIVFSILAERVLQAFSWRAGWVAMGMALWVLTPFMLLLRRRPEDYGLLPDGRQPEADAGGAGGSKPAAAKDEAQFTPRQAVRMPALYIITLAVAIQSFANTSVQFHWFTYMTDRSVSTAAAVASISLAPLIAIPVSVGAGFLVERVSVQKTMAAAYAMFALTILLLLNVGDAFGAYAFGVAFGVSSGVMATMVQLVWPYYFGRASVGAIRGMVSPIHMTANALGPVAAALSYDVLGGYGPIYSTIAASCVVGGVLLMIAKRPVAQPATQPSTSV